MEGNRARITFVFHLALSNIKMALIKGAVKLVIREKRTAPIIVGASNPGKVSDKIEGHLQSNSCGAVVTYSKTLHYLYSAEDVQTPKSFLE